MTVTSDRPPSEIELVEDETELHAVSRRSFIDEQEWYLYKFISSEKKELVNEYSDPSVVRMALCVKCQAARRPAYFIWNIYLITVRMVHRTQNVPVGPCELFDSCSNPQFGIQSTADKDEWLRFTHCQGVESQ